MKLLVIIFNVLLVITNGRELGEIIFGANIPKCPRTGDETQTKCVVNYYTNYVQPILLHGVPIEDYAGILEPFKIDEIPIDVAKVGMNVKGNITNITVTGLSDAVIEQVRYDYGTDKFHVTVRIPKLNVTCRYAAVDSKVLFFNLETKGGFQGTFVNVGVEITGKMDMRFYNNLEYAVVTNIEVSLAYGSGTTVHLEPDDTSFIAKLGVALINFTPARAVLFMFKHEITTATARVLQEKVNELLSTVPLKLVFE